ncbi:MAG: hypothetical protein ABI835_18145 [Chloroflexota bacterium]
MHTPLELAEAFISAGELDDALVALDQQLAAASSDDDARRLRIEVLIRLPGREREALADLDALGELTPDDHLLRAQIYETLGEEDSAFASVEQAWTLHPDSRSTELLLRWLYRRGAAERALILLADQPKSWKWLGWSGDFHALSGNDAIAAEHYGAALDQLAELETNAITETQRAKLLLKRADAYRRLQRFAAAAADYKAAEMIIPTDPMIGFSQSLLACEQGDLQQAVSLYRMAFGRCPEDLRAIMENTLSDDPRYEALTLALLA